MFERFTQEARQSVVQAQAEARALRAPQIDPIHLLLGVAAAGGPGAAALLDAGITLDTLREAVAADGGDRLDAATLATLGVDLDRVRGAVEERFGAGALDRGDKEPTGHIPFAEAGKRALEQSLRQALRGHRAFSRRPKSIDTRHVLLGALDVADPVVTRVLLRLGVQPGSLRRAADRQPDVA